MAPGKVLVQGLPPGVRYDKRVSQEKREDDMWELENLFVKFGRVRCVYLCPKTPYVPWRKWEGFVPDNFAVLEFEDAENAKEACIAAAHRQIKFEGYVLTLTRVSKVARIEILEDDILIKIFSMLDPANKMTIEKVCKRWRKLAPESWKVKALDLGGRVAETERCLDSTLEQYLQRCGQYLEYLTCDVTSPNFIELIRTYCPELNTLHLWIYVKTLSSGSFVGMFRVLRYLRQLEIHYYPQLPGFDVVEYLPKSMEKIYISCTQRDPPSFDVRKFQDLRSLSLKGFVSKLYLNGMDRTRLSHLDLTHSFVNQSIIHQICNLPRLRSLNVSKTNMTDEMVIRILKANPGLEWLDISDNSALSNNAIREALRLPYLEVLKIMKLLVNLDIDLKELPSLSELRELHIEGCSRISNNQLDKFLQFAPRLRYLDVRNSLITPEFLRIADSTVKKRRYYVPLTICTDRNKMPARSYSSRIRIVNSV